MGISFSNLEGSSLYALVSGLQSAGPRSQSDEACRQRILPFGTKNDAIFREAVHLIMFRVYE